MFEDEKDARAIATKRQQLQREQGVRTQKTVTLEELGRRIEVGEFKELNLIGSNIRGKKREIKQLMKAWVALKAKCAHVFEDPTVDSE